MIAIIVEIVGASAGASYCAKLDVIDGAIDGPYVIETLEATLDGALVDAIGVFLCVLVGELVCDEDRCV